METMTNKMRIKIKKNAYVFAGNYNSKGLREWLQENEGKWFEVETDYLFHDQYNIENWRIYDSMLDAVENDARIGKGKCKYCGTMVNLGETCQKYTAENISIIGNSISTCGEYGIDWFTPENTYFMKYPKGLPVKGKEVLSIHEGNKKIGSYYVEKFPSLDYYRIYNCRQTINFKFDGEFYYIHTGIGYKQVKALPIPSTIQEKVKAKVIELSKQGLV